MPNRPKRGAAPSGDRSRQDCHLSSTARLVGVGFRLWLNGCKTGNISCWENAWRLYYHHLGPRSAEAAVGELSAWVRTVSSSSTREIRVMPDTCPGLCRDECLAVAMIAACQHKTCPAMRACAFALIENSGVEQVVDQSERFAMTLVAVDQVLSPDYIVNAAALDIGPMSEYVQ